MPTITGTIINVAGGPDTSSWTFSSPVLRESVDGGEIVGTDAVRVTPDETGLLTVELEEGVATAVHDDVTYEFTVPATDSDLWDLIQAAAMMPPQTTDQQIQAAVDAYLAAHPPSTGADRTVLLLSWNYNTNPAPPPSNNQFRTNSSDQSLVTEIYFNDLDATGISVDLLVPGLVMGDRIVIQDENDAAIWHEYTLSADPVNNGTYWTYPVTWQQGVGTFGGAQTHIVMLMKYWN